MNHSADLVLWRAHFLWIVDNPLLGSAYSLLPTTAHPSSIEAASLSTSTYVVALNMVILTIVNLNLVNQTVVNLNMATI